jgi:hypothetical protein
MPERAKTILLYSESGGTKTSQCVYLAKFIKEKYNKQTRLISADPGGWDPVTQEKLIYHGKNNPEGLVKAFDMTNRTNFMGDWRKLARGYWPKLVRGNPKLGEDENQGYRKFFLTTPEEWEGIGAYFIEGLTSFGSGTLSHIAKQDNSKESIGKVMYTAPGYDEDGEHFGATDQGHVGIAQNEALNLVNQFSILPVHIIIWTSLVEACTQKAARRSGVEIDDMHPLYGPKVAGVAKSAEAPSWFSDCLHIDNEYDKEGNREVKAFFRRHINQDGLTFLAKMSTSPSKTMMFRKRYPGGFIPFSLEEGIGRYLKEL